MSTSDLFPLFTRSAPLLDALRDGVMLVDASGVVQLINKSARDMYRGGEAPLVGYLLAEFNAADWVEVKRVLTSGKALDGGRLTLPAAEVIVDRVPVREHGVVTGVICTMHSLASINAHARHLPAYQALRDDMEALLDQQDVAVLVAQPDGIIREVNVLFERWSGVGRETLVGQCVDALTRDPLCALDALRRCLAFMTTAVGYGCAADGRPVCSVAAPAYVRGHPRFVLVRVLDCIATRDLCAKHLGDSLGDALVDAVPVPVAVEGDEARGGALALARKMGLVVKSRAMTQLVQKATRVSLTESSVLLQGESGVGKSVFAAFLHRLSQRAAGPFVTINCGAIPESLMESELFGYERGAFTGADPKGKVGLLESGHNGTVFLDEIGELPMGMQVKLLDAIDKKAFTRVGGTRMVKANIRIIAATNRTLEDEVRRGQFRKDLYYRLNVIPLTIPALRERPEDIVAVTMDFMSRYNARRNEHKRLSPQVLEILTRHPFHGNMRELINTLEWLVVMSEGQQLTPQDLPMSLRPSEEKTGRTEDFLTPPADLTLKAAAQHAERQCILHALARQNTLFEAAQQLGIHPTTLWRKMVQLDITQDTQV